MKIREKTFAYFGLTLFSLVVIISATISALSFESLRELENQRIRDNVTRIQGYLENERERLRFLTLDWGAWDESYKFMLGGNSGYAAQNLTTNAILNFGANIVAYAQLDGTPAWAKYIDLESSDISALPDLFMAELAQTPLLVKADHTSGPVSISMMIEGKPYIIAAGPIIKSDYQGPAVGSIIFARELNQQFLQVMSERLRLKIDIIEDVNSKPDGVTAALTSNLTEEFLHIRQISKSRDYTTIDLVEKNHRGEPAFYFEFKIYRDIYKQGIKQLGFMILGVAGSSIILGFVFWLLLKRNVLDRLGKMNEEVRRIQTSGDLAKRIHVPGNDELSDLSNEMNQMLSTIREQRKASELYLSVARIMIGALDRNGRLTMINPRGCELLGFSRGEIIGMDWFANFIPVRFRVEMVALYGKIMRGESEMVQFYENHVVAKSGRELLLSSHSELIRGADGGIEGVIFSAEDITDRRQRDEERARLEKLESLGLMAGGIAHDFNNTLTAIMANIDLLKPEANVPETERPEIIKDAMEGAQRARDLTRQLLTFAKGGDPVREIIHLGDLIRNSVRFALRGSVSRHHIHIDERLWAVSVDITQITQVILNVVINADHAMPNGGVVHVKVSNTQIKQSSIIPIKTGDYVLIEISDEGHGIPAEEINRIFDPYYTTKSTGSGLGLSTSFSIVRRHGGHITVQSNVGVGSSFRIYIPAVTGADIKKEGRPATPARSLKGARILAVDDDEVVLRLIQRVLVSKGCVVETAEGSGPAMEKIAEMKKNRTSFDLILLDLIMPGDIGGLEILRQMRDVTPGLKAVVVSGYSNDPVIADPAKYGFNRAVSKPFEPDQLIEAIIETLQR